MQKGTRVKFSDDYLRSQSKFAIYLRREEWRGVVIKTSGKNEICTHVKWDNKKTIQQYHCNFIIRCED